MSKSQHKSDFHDFPIQNVGDLKLFKQKKIENSKIAIDDIN